MSLLKELSLVLENILSPISRADKVDLKVSNPELANILTPFSKESRLHSNVVMLSAEANIFLALTSDDKLPLKDSNFSHPSTKLLTFMRDGA
jgi:hypothetical protein